MALLNRIAVRVLRPNIRNSSVAAQAIQVQEESTQTFRTKESNPVNHDEQHINRFYTIPAENVKTIFTHGMNGDYKEQSKTFAELSLLVRKPAVELLSYLTQTDYTKPANRYVIYGENGCGKTTTLMHILHYGYTSKKIIVNVYYAQKWFKHPKEVSRSETREGLMDLPIDAATWLAHFKNQNYSLLEQADIRLSKDYEWSPIEKSSQGSSLIELLEFGISRAKYACDILIVLMSELKQASTAGKCKILVVIDGYNAFFSNHTRVKNDQYVYVSASEVSLTHAFLDITKSDWCNGQIVVAVDIQATKERRDSHLPRYLLSKEGFEHLDPFLPINVGNYSEDEFDTVIEYYKNRKWIRHITPEGIKELRLLSGYNPRKLMDCCKSL